MKADFSAQTRQALDNVATVLSAAHMSMKNVLWVNPYFSVSGQYDVMGKVYKTYFEFGNTPGRGTIQVVGLPHEEHIVFSCIAGADLSKRKAVRPRNMPPSPTASPGILYGDTLYLSAKDGFIPGQGMVTQLFDLQLRQSMRNLLDGLEEVDMDFSNVVFSTVYLRQMKDNKQMNDLYGTFFKPPYPARTTIQQNFETDEEAAEQISFIAVRGKKMKRRTFMKWAAAFPLLAQVGFHEALGTGWAQVARNSTDNLYTRLGVKPLINGRGTWTYLSASLELPEVRAAQVEASQHFVNIFDLQLAAGRRLAELTGAESGMITSGAAGAMAVATAGCIAGTDPDKVWQLPNTDGLKNEVVMVGGRSVFDSAIRLAGGKLVLADSAEQIANAITGTR